MSQPKPGKASGREAPIEDPLLVREAMNALLTSEIEFPIKVEGASTLPYTSAVAQLDGAKGIFILKLIRPLPHELMSGAIFRMIFAVEDQRYEALITFIRRESYLHYSFRLPTNLFYSDRRSQKRFSFRPRENAYVTSQDGGTPGIGVAGPLANIGMGGLAMRVDRILKLDDGMRIPPSTAVFERGKAFLRVRIQEMPRLPVFDLSGWVTHMSERGSELILGFAFRELSEEEASQLRASLDFREKMFRSVAGGTVPDVSQRATRAEQRPQRVAEAPATSVTSEEAPSQNESHGSELDPLLLLSRRTLHLAVAVPSGERRDAIVAQLRTCGYLRYELAGSLAELQAMAATQGEAGSSIRLLLADLSVVMAEVGEPLAAVRLVEHHAEELGQIPTLFLCENLDPTMLMAQARATRFLSLEEGGIRELGPALDSVRELAVASFS